MGRDISCQHSPTLTAVHQISARRRGMGWLQLHRVLQMKREKQREYLGIVCERKREGG